MWRELTLVFGDRWYSHTLGTIHQTQTEMHLDPLMLAHGRYEYSGEEWLSYVH